MPVTGLSESAAGESQNDPTRLTRAFLCVVSMSVALGIDHYTAGIKETSYGVMESAYLRIDEPRIYQKNRLTSRSSS